MLQADAGRGGRAGRDGRRGRHGDRNRVDGGGRGARRGPRRAGPGGPGRRKLPADRGEAVRLGTTDPAVGLRRHDAPAGLAPVRSRARAREEGHPDPGRDHRRRRRHVDQRDRGRHDRRRQLAPRPAVRALGGVRPRRPGLGGCTPLLLLWPVEENFPDGGEIDWMENCPIRPSEDRLLPALRRGQPAGERRRRARRHAVVGVGAGVDAGEDHRLRERQGVVLDHRDRPLPARRDEHDDAARLLRQDAAVRQRCTWTGRTSGRCRRASPRSCRCRPGAPATGQPRDYPDRKPRPLDGSAPPSDTGDDSGSGQGDQDKGSDKGSGSGQGDSGQGDSGKGGSGKGDSGSEGGAAPAGDATAGRPRVLHPDTSTAEPAGTGQRPRTLHP